MTRSYPKRDGTRIASAVLVALVACVWDSASGRRRCRGRVFREQDPAGPGRACYECHSSQSKKLRGGLRLDTREGIRAGGETGPAIVPSNLDESLLFQAISAVQGIEPMPPKGKLSGNVVADFRQWIKMERQTLATARLRLNCPQRRRADRIGGRMQPLKRPAVPRIPASAAGWPGNPIERSCSPSSEKKVSPIRRRPTDVR